ncbi:MAG: RNA methyltransferase [Methanotrichaceae archaeon]|nr:RNA methyltransferase [Methanotrichaceae archaeon]
MNCRVVLVEPIYDGNIGSIARAMKNFGFDDLILVNPCPIHDFGWAMASHAKDVLERARTVRTIEEATTEANLVIGTTGKRLVNKQKHLRLHLRVPCLTPFELSEKLKGKQGVVAILLGREDIGLTSQELAKCDMLVSIPTSQEYPVMNLSHAAAVLFYELSHLEGGNNSLASQESLRLLHEKTRSLLRAICYPEHKIEYTVLMFKRILGRTELTERETRTILGVIKSLRWQIDKVQSGRK